MEKVCAKSRVSLPLSGLRNKPHYTVPSCHTATPRNSKNTSCYSVRLDFQWMHSTHMVCFCAFPLVCTLEIEMCEIKIGRLGLSGNIRTKGRDETLSIKLVCTIGKHASCWFPILSYMRGSAVIHRTAIFLLGNQMAVEAVVKTNRMLWRKRSPSYPIYQLSMQKRRGGFSFPLACLYKRTLLHFPQKSNLQLQSSHSERNLSFTRESFLLAADKEVPLMSRVPLQSFLEPDNKGL